MNNEEIKTNDEKNISEEIQDLSKSELKEEEEINRQMEVNQDLSKNELKEGEEINRQVEENQDLSKNELKEGEEINKQMEENNKPLTKYDKCISEVDPELLKKWEEEQNLLKSKLIEKDELDFEYSEESKTLKRIGGLDISTSKSKPDVAVVAFVICDAENFKILYEKYEFVNLTQPYVPGFLAFREVEHLVKLIEDLKNTQPELLPQIILTDGNGILHSNRFGIACHLGVLTGIPTIGCGKSIFNVDGIKKHAVRSAVKDLKECGEFLYLEGVSGATWGAALKCTEQSIDPIIISIGHKISLETAIRIVKNSCRFRVPEPIRIADITSRALIRQFEKTKSIFDSAEYLKKVNFDITNHEIQKIK